MFLIYFIGVVGALIVIILVAKSAWRFVLGEYLWFEKRDSSYWDLIKKVEAEKEKENDNNIT